MIKGKNIKRGTVLVVASVIILTLVTMNVTYSAFFSVQTANTVQVITTGDLTIEAKASNVTVPAEGLMPSNEYTSINATNAKVDGTNFVKSTLTITNKSNIPAQIGVSIKNTAGNDNADLSHVVIAIQKSSAWVPFKSNVYYTTIKGLQAETGDASLYPIIKDSIAAGPSTTVAYDIYMWVDEITPEDQVDKALNYSVVVKAAPSEGQDTDNTVPSVNKVS